MKRKTLIVALAVCLVAIMAFGTLAFFSAQDSVTNNFKIASSPDPDQDPFSVKVEETDPETGEPTTDGVTYDNIKPGDELQKDPTVINDGLYSEYVRVNVTVTNATAWKAACEKHSITDLTTIFGGFDGTKWTRVGDPVFDEVADTLTYSYYYNGVLAPSESAVLFTSVTIPAAFDTADMVSLANFQLIVTADAIQSEHTGDSAADAFVLYDEQVAKEAA